MTQTAVPLSAQERAIEIFNRAAIAHKTATSKYEHIREEAETLQAAIAGANEELQWVQTHPALQGVDIAALYAAAGSEKDDAEGGEAESKPKRTRRTKAQIAADKAAEEAKAAAATEPKPAEEVEEPQVDEGETDPEAAAEPGQQPAQAPVAVPAVQEPVEAPQPTFQQPPAGVPAPTPAPAPSAAPAGDFNPFGPR